MNCLNRRIRSPIMNSDPKPILLKDGFIIDGSGSKGFKGNLLIRGKTIQAVSRQEIPGPSLHP